MALANFSVLMPVYIKEEPAFLDRALQSIMQQSLLPSEIVIVEDGPLTQPLYDVIAGYKKQYPEIFNVITLPENRGMGYAMDTGLRNCKYEYVARMDSDDIALPHRFLKQFQYLEQHPEVDILGSCIEEFSKEPGDLKQYRKVPQTHDEIRKFMKYRCPMNHMTVVFRRQKVLNAGSYWHNRALEDYHLWYRMMMSGCRFYNFPEVLVYARIGNNMVGRRRGINYVRNEYNFFRIMKNERFITHWEFYGYSAIRAIIKLIPLGLVKLFYTKFLR